MESLESSKLVFNFEKLPLANKLEVFEEILCSLVNEMENQKDVSFYRDVQIFYDMWKNIEEKLKS